ncbi:GGDEF domain-containing protein [Eubacterium oxidoreducens]|uniref:Diguanylate cyclase (GGDEF) domain-containing protein n=1 Tax=Eubacterium oxidoreducens TaxID=1732 RepID=A0A1G6BCT1_EUBOX|nr:GGDEF domain-containing protein [Eubacterium oxidoreducens]SDB18339.1 diguanylate cyclase (GGDEF) domain-containing protein [Eubacterium oxidoreducens]
MFFLANDEVEVEQSEELNEYIRKSEREIEAKWRKIHFNMLLLVSVCIIICEVLVSLLLLVKSDMISHLERYIIRYLLVPGSSYLIIDLIAYFGMKKLNRQGWKLNYLLSVLLAVMCVLISLYHAVFPSVYGLGILAIIMTFIYGNHKIGLTTMLVVLCGGFASFTFLPWDHDVTHGIVYDISAFIMFVASIGVYILGGAVVVWEQQFRRNAIMGNYKLDNLKKVAARDYLTGVRNRFGMQKYIEQLNGTCRCVMLDVDYFKKVNDRWGHDLGDQILENLGEILERYERMDRAFFRYGGDEFLCIVQNHTISELTSICDEIVASFEQLLGMDLKKEKISITYGISPEVDVMEIQSGIMMADKELYKRKKARY